jgi:hypothetical protein
VYRSHAVRLEDNETFNTVTSGIGVWWSSDVFVTGNEIVRACTGGHQETISVAGTDGFEVSGNVVHDSADQEGICIKDGSMNGTVHDNLVFDVPEVGIYIDAWDTPRTSGISIYRNTVHDNGNGILTASETGGFLEDVSIFNNLVYHNEFYGIAVTRNGTAPLHPARGITIVNNTVWNNGYTWGGGIAVDNPDATEVVVRNNIVSDNLSFQLALSGDVPSGAVTFDHNLVDGYRGNPEGEIYGDDYVEGDPLFVDPAGGDFHLRAGSPAVDAGSADGAPGWDFDGVARPQGGGYDIGAYELPTGGTVAGWHPVRWEMW